MKMTPQNLIHHELIGLTVEIADSSNPSLIGINGKVIDETKNMLIIQSDGIKKIPKSCVSFTFTIPEEEVRVKINGELLLSQPENRVKGIKRIKEV